MKKYVAEGWRGSTRQSTCRTLYSADARLDVHAATRSSVKVSRGRLLTFGSSINSFASQSDLFFALDSRRSFLGSRSFLGHSDALKPQYLGVDDDSHTPKKDEAGKVPHNSPHPVFPPDAEPRRTATRTDARHKPTPA
jgi:hypothetical protein